MSDLELTAAFGDYDRTGLLERGTTVSYTHLTLPTTPYV